MKKQLLILAITGTAFFGCRKEDAQVDTETQSAIDYSVSEVTWSGLAVAVNQVAAAAAKQKGDSVKMAGSCVVYRMEGDTTAFPDSGNVTITIDYGTALCAGEDGRRRTGTVKVNFPKGWINGSVAEISLANFKDNFLTFSGSARLTKKDSAYTYSVTSGRTTDSLWTSDFSAEKTMVMTAGALTDSTATDDIYRITGTSSGVNRQGRKYTASIATALTINGSCSWIEQGTVNITPEELGVRVLNFGNTGCDPQATMSTNGNLFHFNLR